MIAGLLVLAVLLAPAAQAHPAAIASLHHHHANVLAQTITVADRGTTAPVHDADHGLPCCIDGQCIGHASWLPVHDNALPVPSSHMAATIPASDLSHIGLVTHPPLPPPRGGV
jgi:hypothetical protein